MLMREALFANPWPIWLFALMNTDHEGLVSKLGESEASHYREQILLKLREHQVPAQENGSPCKSWESHRAVSLIREV